MNKLNLLTMDYETYFAVKYSLKQLGVINYVRDERFKAHGAAVKHNFDPSEWITHDDLPKWIASQDWANTFLICHNTPFDAFINTERYNVPHGLVEYTDTLSLARGIFPPGIRLDLDNIGRILGVGRKTDDLIKSKGIRDLPPDLEQTIAEYSINDNELTFKVFMALWRHLPWHEHELVHMHIRMAVEPELEINRELSQEAYDEEVAAQKAAVAASGYAKKQLASNPQFVKILESLNIEVPMKESPKTGKQSPALALGDLGFKTMMVDHPEHQALWDGRIAAKSTIGISRAKRWLDIHDAGKHTLPMPTKYYGAHTGRSSGADGINVQNLKRQVPGDPNSGKLRRAIIAPKGYVILVGDSSQIEMRQNMWLAGQKDMLEVFRRGEDPYSYSATQHFGYKVEKKTHPNERQYGKMRELALGFGMGGVKFRTNAALGFMGCPPVVMTRDEAFLAVLKYRTEKDKVKAMWDYLQAMLPLLGSKDPHARAVYKCLEFVAGKIILPNGMALQYPNLHVNDEGDWLYGIGDNVTRIYGGKEDENVVQSLARIVVFEQLRRIDKTEGIHLVSTTHDEGISLVREYEAEEAAKYVQAEMSISPDWAPDLPLAAEVGFAYEYSK